MSRLIADLHRIPSGIRGPEKKGRRLERDFPFPGLRQEPHLRGPDRQRGAGDRPRTGPKSHLILRNFPNLPCCAQPLLCKQVLFQEKITGLPDGIEAQNRHDPCQQLVPPEPRNAEKIPPALRSTGKQPFFRSGHQALSMLSTTLPLRNSSWVFSTAWRTSLSG